MRFALIGNPISHSLSPALFRAAYPNSRHTYELLETSSIDEAVMRFSEEGFDGLNVTTPFKEEILKFTNKRDHLTELIGASNLILKDGNLVSAYNTDFFGVKECIKSLVSKDDRVLVLGCGGAGRAASLAASSEGCNVTIVNRSYDRAKKFCDSAGMLYNRIEMLTEEFQNCKLFINTLSTRLEILDSFDYRGKIVLEANYRFPQLSFIEKRYNAKYISGKSWLLYQAVQSFQMFTSSLPDFDSMQFMLNNI
ncbi:MAG: hypothetical protein ABFC28_03730 [Rikenellaceae bacterium]